MGTKLRCVACGHRIELGDAYDEYEGLLRCWTCGALMEICLRDGRLRGMRPAEGGER